MNIAIVNAINGRMTDYTPQQLRRDAQHAVKDYGKLISYWVTFTEGKSAVLVAQYKQPDGWCGSVNVAI
jgi:hypothetical protein